MGSYFSQEVKSVCAYGQGCLCCQTQHTPGYKISQKRRPPAFGKEIRDEEFDLLEEWTYLNHGSWGVVPNKVKEVQLINTREMEQAPDAWFGGRAIELTNENKIPVAAFLGADPDDMVFVENTTKGVSNVMKCIEWQPGDGILINNWTYSAMKNCVQYIKDILQPGVEIIVIDHPLPIADSVQIISQYEEVLGNNPNIRLALIDHISSMPSLLFPVKELCSLCREYGVLSLVDGAHCPGQLMNIDIPDIGADYYVGNIHKWCWGARGSAIQWVSPSLQASQRPTVTSVVYGLPWPFDFYMQGARDGTGFTACAESLAFYDFMGGMQAAWDYNTSLASAAAAMLAEAWGTHVLEVPDDMVAPFMPLILLPEVKAYPVTREGNARLTLTLAEEYKIFSRTGSLDGIDGRWVRVSVNVYCTMEDMEKLRDSILDLATWSANDPRRITRPLTELELRNAAA